MIKYFSLLASNILLLSSVYSTTLIVSNINNSGSGSLRDQIIASSPDDIITFDPALISGGSATIYLLSEIAFNKSITISGLYNANDTLYLSGGNTNRIFSISSTPSITLDSLFFIDGYSAYGGGAIQIYAVKNLSVTNCFFSRNRALSPYRGGAININDYTQNSIDVKSITIHNSTFNQNSAEYGGGFSCTSYGGFSNQVVISNSTFSNNSASYGGGILYDSYTDSIPNYTPLIITDCSITENSAQNGGGGVWIASQANSPLTTKIENSSINDNSAVNSGGGIFYFYNGDYDANFLIDNCQVSNNQSLNGGGLYYIGYNDSLIVIRTTIVNSTFSNNTASYDGGGMGFYLNGQAPFFLDIEQSTICYNTTVNESSSRGSGITVTNVVSDVEMNLKNSTIIENTGTSENCAGLFFECDSALVRVSSNIVALNNPKNIQSSGFLTIESGGNNCFSDSVMLGSISSDQLNVTASTLNLGALDFNGGSTKTRLPLSNSIATDGGNSLDLVNPQNGFIFGTRDVGAAESCYSRILDNQTACNSLVWIDGNTYTSSNAMASVVLTNSLGCDSTIILNLTLFEGLVVVQQINSTTLFSNLYGDSLQWLNCDNSYSIIPGETNQSFTPTNSGNYAVAAYLNSCLDTSNCFSWNPVSLNENDFQNILVYPTPASDYITVKSPEIISDLFLQTTDGKIINLLLPAKNQSEIIISLDDQSSGVYFLYISSNKRTIIRKIVIFK